MTTPGVQEVSREEGRAKKEKKEILTKQQKRRLADRCSECLCQGGGGRDNCDCA